MSELEERLGIESLVDLALLLPKRLKDEAQATDCELGKNLAVQIEVMSKESVSNRLQIRAWCKSLEQECLITIFNPLRWHYAKFKDSLIIYGKASAYKGLLAFSNPKVLSSFGELEPLWLIRGVKDQDIAKLIQKRLSEEGLIKEGLRQNDARFLCQLHQDYGQVELDNSSFLRRLKFIEIYAYLVAINRQKQKAKSPIISERSLDSWYKSLPFALTPDQLQTIKDIQKDLITPEASRRVIMGDVGCGKTMIMLAAALLCYPQKAILMAPTSLLAEQIYNEAKKFLPSYLKTTLLKKGAKRIDPEAHFIIGTHVLLYQDLPPAPLVMVDEQHRFGSSQRQKINQLAASKDPNSPKLSPHFLQFSATPIPRTLAMIQSSAATFSFIKTLPFEKNIKTICVEEDAQNSKSKELIQIAKDAISKGGQALIIYPLVEESASSAYKPLQAALPYYEKNFSRVHVTHGKDKDKEAVLEDFKDKGELLISTTVVEVGISLPRLNLIIIIGAERFGLATLHQLRGRVGRAGQESFCYLYSKKPIPERLKEFSTTLDGFKIAELDLKNRDTGDLQGGATQSGKHFRYFDLSQDERILKQAQEALKEELSCLL